MNVILIYMNLEDQRDLEWQVDESICTECNHNKVEPTKQTNVYLLELSLKWKEFSFISSISEIWHQLDFLQVNRQNSMFLQNLQTITPLYKTKYCFTVIVMSFRFYFFVLTNSDIELFLPFLSLWFRTLVFKKL